MLLRRFALVTAYSNWRSQMSTGQWKGHLKNSVSNVHFAFKQSIMLSSIVEQLESHGTQVIRGSRLAALSCWI